MKLPSIFGPAAADPSLCCHYKDHGGIATVLNRWWVDGAPMPDAKTAGTLFMQSNPYFEVMLNGNMLLPEDLLTGIAKYSDDPVSKAPGLWGKPLGAELGEWMRAHNRPLIWADYETSAMLLDPNVGSLQVSTFHASML